MLMSFSPASVHADSGARAKCFGACADAAQSCLNNATRQYNIAFFACIAGLNPFAIVICEAAAAANCDIAVGYCMDTLTQCENNCPKE